MLNIPLPVDILFVDVGSVNNLMRDGLILHLVCAADANRLVPGHLATKAPGSQQQHTKDRKGALHQFEAYAHGLFMSPSKNV